MARKLAALHRLTEQLATFTAPVGAKAEPPVRQALSHGGASGHLTCPAGGHNMRSQHSPRRLS